MTINGLIVTDCNTELRGATRKLYRANRVHSSVVQSFFTSFDGLARLAEDMAQRRVQEAVSLFHDVRTSIGLLMAASQSIVDQTPGYGFDNKLENSDPQIRQVFFATSLLADQLNLLDVVVNPERITYGRKRRTAVYKLFHKMARLFHDRALRRDIHIDMRGTSYDETLAFESFQFVPLILLDNAVKYSLTGRTINIYVDDNPGTSSIDVCVSSYGPIVDPANRTRIFEKQTRGDNARMFSAEGSGTGLYLAQLIGRAHGFEIAYDCAPSDHHGVKPTGRNDFRFSIPVE